MVDHQVDAVDDAREVVRLDVDHRDALELGDLRRRDDLDVDVEQVHHPLVLRPRDAVQRADDGRLSGAVEQRAQREPAGQRVRVGIVVKQDQDAVGVAEEPLVLLHLESRERAAELGDERAAEQLRHGDVVQLGKLAT